MRTLLQRRLASSTALAASALAASTLLVLAGSPARAQVPGAPASAPTLRSLPAAAEPVVKPLPAGHDDLVFRGENATRTWSVNLSREEASRVTTFQLAMLNSISVLPDRSSLKLTINGHALTSVPLRSSAKLTDLGVRIPSGFLVPGFNAVQVDVTQVHRVDCSLKATYELWSLLDPSRTGFVVPGQSAGSVRGLDELAAEPLAADGTTRIRLRLPAGADADGLDRAARFVSALVTRAHLARPVVDVGQDGGAGPGLDVVIATADAVDGMGLDQVRVLGRDQDLVLARDARTDRLVLVVSGPEEGDLDSVVNRFAQAPALPALGTPEALALLDRQAGTPIEGAVEVPLGSLGWQGATFAGRHYESSLRIELPEDFYPGNYGTAHLYLDGTRPGALDRGSGLTFWVNGKLVSSLDLSQAQDRLEHEQIDLPLRFFRPGGNEIGIKAVATTAADAQCDMATMATTPRLTLAGTSELEVPAVAHLGTLMRMQRSLRFGPAGEDRAPLDIYLADQDRGSVNAGMTIAANVAKNSRRAGAVRFHFEAPGKDSPPGIVVAPTDALPAFLAPRLAALVRKPVDQPAASAPSAEAPAGALESAAAANQAALKTTANRWAWAGLDWFRDRGFFFATEQRTDALALSSDRSMVMATIDPDEAVARVAGLDLPRFSRDGRQWLVVTADRPETYEAGTARLTTDGRWPTLSGQAMSLDVDTGQVQSVEAPQASYILPHRLAVSDIRPVLGGFVSNNIALSAALLMGLLSILGLSAHTLLRNLGTKGR